MLQIHKVPCNFLSAFPINRNVLEIVKKVTIEYNKIVITDTEYGI